MNPRSTHILELLSDYLDDALPTKQRQEVEEHLHQCTDCKARWEEFREQRTALRKSPMLQPPEHFYRSVWERIDHPADPRATWSPWTWAMPTKAMATACVVAVIVLVTREARQPGVVLPTDALVTGKTAHLIETPPAPPATPASAFGPKALNVPEAASPAKEEVAAVSQPIPEREEAKKTKSTSGMAKRVLLAMQENTGAPSAAEKKPVLEPRAFAKDSMKSLPAPLPPGAVQQARDINGVASQAPLLAENKIVAHTAPVAADEALNNLAVSGSMGGSASLAAGNAAPMAAQSVVNGINQPADRKTLPPVGLDWKGSSSGIGDFRTVVIQNTPEWQTLWTQHTQKMAPPPPLPIVDFSQWTLVGIFEGSKPSAGYAVTITGVKNNPDSIEVDYQEQSPTPSMMDAAVITQPFHLRLIPKTSLPVHFVQVPS